MQSEPRSLEAARALGFPCIAKPVSLSASRGVLRVGDEAELSTAVREIRAILSEIDGGDREPMLLEEYVPGWEVSIDGLLTDGKLAVTAVFDKPDTPDGPTFEETLLVTPSRLPQATLATGHRPCTTRGPRARAALRSDPRRAPHRRAGRVRQGPSCWSSPRARSVASARARCAFWTASSLEMMILLNALGVTVTASPPSGATGVLMLPGGAFRRAGKRR